MNLIEAFKALCEKPDDAELFRQFEQLEAQPENQAQAVLISKTALHFGWLENGILIWNPDFSEYDEGLVIWETAESKLLYGYSPNDSLPYENTATLAEFFAKLQQYQNGTAYPFYPAILPNDWGEIPHYVGDYSNIEQRICFKHSVPEEFFINAFVQ